VGPANLCNQRAVEQLRLLGLELLGGRDVVVHHVALDQLGDVSASAFELWRGWEGAVVVVRERERRGLARRGLTPPGLVVARAWRIRSLALVVHGLARVA
jgi:hypothetical protein